MTRLHVHQDKFGFRTQLEGLLVGLGLILLEIFVFLLIQPVKAVFSLPGLFVNAVILLAGSFLSLEHSLNIKINDASQVLWGVFGGLMAWMFLEYSSWLSGQTITDLSALFYFTFSFLFVWALWRRIPSFGLRYFLLMILVGWGGHLLLDAIKRAIIYDQNLAFLLPLTGYLAAVGGILAVAALFFRIRNRLQCLNAALLIWAAFTAVIYVFQFT